MTMITPSYLGETIEYSSLHACRSTLEDPTSPVPTIVLFVNDPELMHFAYQRYLENRIRAVFGFAGVRLRIVTRHRDESDD